MSLAIEKLARRQLADLEALSPGTYFGEPHAPLSVKEAYEVQDRVTALRVANGDRIAGYKLGCLEPKINQTCLDNVPLWGFSGGSEEALAWLSANLSSSGMQLEPGQLVLTGTLSGLFPAKAGDHIRVAVDGSAEVTATVAA